MDAASPVMSWRRSAGDGRSCRRAPWARTGQLPDSPVPPVRLALIDGVGLGIGTVNLARQ